jgi:hypothetical protein
VTELQVEKYAYEHYFFQDNVYVGENYAAYATYVWYDDNDENETKNDMYYINRLNLKTLETENDILEIKGGGPHILGSLQTEGSCSVIIIEKAKAVYVLRNREDRNIFLTLLVY